MYDTWILTVLLAWPLVAAGVVLVAPERWAKHLALAATIVEFALSVPLWWRFVPANGMQFQQVFAGTNRHHSGTERSEEHTSELQSHHDLVCRLLLEKKKKKK